MTRLSPQAALAALNESVAAMALPNQPAPLFQSLEKTLGAAVGHKLFTMAVYRGDGSAERVYSNQPGPYPVGGRKTMQHTPWGAQVIDGRKPFLGRTRADIRWAFYDHELIESLGLGSAINLLVQYDGALLGTINLLHEENYYQEADLPTGAPFAALLAPAFARMQRT
jgi:hypothetical protein